MSYFTEKWNFWVGGCVRSEMCLAAFQLSLYWFRRLVCPCVLKGQPLLTIQRHFHASAYVWGVWSRFSLEVGSKSHCVWSRFDHSQTPSEKIIRPAARGSTNHPYPGYKYPAGRLSPVRSCGFGDGQLRHYCSKISQDACLLKSIFRNFAAHKKLIKYSGSAWSKRPYIPIFRSKSHRIDE